MKNILLCITWYNVIVTAIIVYLCRKGDVLTTNASWQSSKIKVKGDARGAHRFEGEDSGHERAM